MTWILWLDDERKCPFYNERPNVFVSWSYSGAVTLLEQKGAPSEVHLDHDLGNCPSGYDFAKLMIEWDMNGFIDLPLDLKVFSQSSNPSGRENILRVLENYLEYKRNNGEVDKAFLEWFNSEPVEADFDDHEAMAKSAFKAGVEWGRRHDGRD